MEWLKRLTVDAQRDERTIKSALSSLSRASSLKTEPDVSPDDFSLMMQNLLKDRFALRFRTETHEAQVYVLLPAKKRLKLPDARPEPCIYGRKAPDANPQAGCAGGQSNNRMFQHHRIVAPVSIHV
jgi:uncharacterized protein (TIGR03435 family)